MNTREDVCRHIERAGLVPVVRAPSAALAERAAHALVGAGISVLEITLTVPDAVRVIETLAARYAGTAVVGVGTVLSADEVAVHVRAGAAFVVTPGFDPAIVEAAHALGVAAFAGALTPTEVIAAMKAGADMIKIFPCSALGGAKYLRALRGPLPGLKLLPTGGVTVHTVYEYIEAGATALGVGSELVDAKLLATAGDGPLDGLAARAREFLDALHKARHL
jgi:2-dehydro-3-deoxyphosphogluconate aldolase/(4S)-4-hydroxy-2-oxoglutarate aldolase